MALVPRETTKPPIKKMTRAEVEEKREVLIGYSALVRENLALLDYIESVEGAIEEPSEEPSEQTEEQPEV